MTQTAQPGPQPWQRPPYQQQPQYQQPYQQPSGPPYQQPPGPPFQQPPGTPYQSQSGPPYQQPQHGSPQPQPAMAAQLQCRLCGSVPAAEVTFRGHQGMIIIMRYLSLAGPFCRDCGLSTFRSMTSKTLVQGWWGYFSFIITPITVLINLARRGKVANLPAPQPAPNGQSRRPMDPGPPLLSRPMTWIGLGIPLALFLLIIVGSVVAALSGA